MFSSFVSVLRRIPERASMVKVKDSDGSGWFSEAFRLFFACSGRALFGTTSVVNKMVSHCLLCQPLLYILYMSMITSNLGFDIDICSIQSFASSIAHF